MMPLLVALLALFAAGLALFVWMTRIEPRRFRTRHMVFDATKVGLPALRLLHLTDTHFHGRDQAILSFLEDLAHRETVDLVFWTGDLIETPAGVSSMARAARLFRPRLGTFAVLGGHDYWRHGVPEAYLRLLSRKHKQGFSVANPAGQLKDALAAAGVRVLEDEACVVPGAGVPPLAVVGLQDAFLCEPDYDASWAGVPEGAAVIVLSHSPDVRPEVPKRGARLALCGHTHGGQVRLPFVGALVTRSDLPGRLASGAFRSGGTTFVISNGLGSSPATPFRLLCRPEAVVIELAASPDPQTLAPVGEADDA